MNSEWVMHARRVAQRPEVREALQLLYADVQKEINDRRPRCEMSGRCCRFEEYGHAMYVTTVELGGFLGEFQEQVTPDRLRNVFSPWNGKGCPFQIGKLCGVHAIRPFGCRIFFCDPSSTQWQHEQYELFHARLKELHRTFDVPYAYVEWQSAMRELFGQVLLAGKAGHAENVGQSI